MSRAFCVGAILVTLCTQATTEPAPQATTGSAPQATTASVPQATTASVPQATTGAQPRVRRFASVIGVKEEKLTYYKQLHADPWPEVNRKISQCNIRNYSIYLRKMPDGQHYLFSYFEYVGDDFEADMKEMADDPMTQKWWKETDPCQRPLPDRKEDEHWASMEEVYHLD